MTASTAKSISATVRRLTEPFFDSSVDDELLRRLVASLFATPVSLYAAIAMSCIVTFADWLLTAEDIFLIYFALVVIFGLMRVLLVFAYDSEPSHDGDTRAHTRFLARQALLLGFAYTFVLGLSNYSLLRAPVDRSVDSLAVAVTIGYAVAFVTRSSARPSLLAAQILGLCAPVIYGYATLPIPHGKVYFGLTVLFAGSAIAMGLSTYGRVVELFRANDELHRLARYDMLTGLFNRFTLAEALETMVRDASKAGRRRFAVILVDLDRFKEINDTLGHEVGDAVIVETASRLRATVGEGDIVGRLGGDEFVVLAQSRPGDGDFGRQIADGIVEGVSQPFHVDSTALPLAASVGVAYFPDHGGSGGELLKKADIALYEAKRCGRATTCVFSEPLEQRLALARLLERDILSGLEQDQFEPWFQPIQNIETGVVTGYEALARWRHPQRGVLLPERFVSIAEQTGAIDALGAVILRKACVAVSHLPPEVSVSVNLSPLQFRRPAHLVRTIKDVMAETSLDPSRLCLEVTEALLIEDPGRARATLDMLVELGIRFALDDFGVGYSSLAHIQDYPFSKIKIGQTFIERADGDSMSGAVLAAVCVLAERASLDIIAEGVETQTQHARVRHLGLKLAQGYFYGRPSPRIVTPRELAFATAG
jgi:diguanylate cyclase (GGDEF)-like protein